jgi:hypothetical protein
MLFGLFMSYLLYFHYRSCYVPIEAIKKKYKTRWIARYEKEITRIQDELEREGPPDGSFVSFLLFPKRVVTLMQRYLLHEELENLIALREKAAAAPITISIQYTAAARMTAAKILAPFVSSIILPTILDYLKDWLGNLLPTFL